MAYDKVMQEPLVCIGTEFATHDKKTATVIGFTRETVRCRVDGAECCVKFADIERALFLREVCACV